MAYNAGFPVGYAYPQYTIPQASAPQQQNNAGMIWVSGEAGAKAYLVAPNTTVQLWDSEAQTIYLKSADGSGMPTMKVLDYTIRDAQPQTTPTLMQDAIPEYVTKSEFDTFAEKMQKQLDKVTAQRRRQREREEEDDE